MSTENCGAHMMMPRCTAGSTADPGQHQTAPRVPRSGERVTGGHREESSRQDHDGVMVADHSRRSNRRDCGHRLAEPLVGDL